MNWRTITTWVVIVAVIGILGYDGFVIFTAGKEASVSQVIIDMSYEYPSVTFITGFTMGHLFWRMGDRKKQETNVQQGSTK